MGLQPVRYEPSLTRRDGRQIGYGRDADGNVTLLTWPPEAGDAYQVTYVYDVLGRVTGVYEGIGTTGFRLGTYGYDTASRRLSLVRGNNNTRTDWGWRPDGLVQTLTHSFASGGGPIAFTYLYNREGGLSGRLLNDAAWQAVPALQTNTAYTANALNQYGSVGAASFAYDTNGNLTSDGTVSYRYDVQNRLVGYTQGAAVVSYAYDAEGRRVSRTQGATTTRFLYAMGQEIAEYTGAAPGTLSARYVPGAGLDEPLAVVTGTPASRQRFWYYADAQGSVIGRTGGGGGLPATTQRFTYTPYGVTGAGSGNPPAFRWLGRRLEPGPGLYDMRARVYSTSLGRFLQPDPIGTEGGINLYAYVRNSPLNDVDTSGLIGFGASAGGIARLQGKGGLGSNLIMSGGESEAARFGREIHRNYNPGQNYLLNQQIPGSPSAMRPDAVDYQRGVVRELKPDTPEGRRAGFVSLGRYIEELERTQGRQFRGQLDVYDARGNVRTLPLEMTRRGLHFPPNLFRGGVGVRGRE